jgi:DNA-binding MarR family transcriptional regulator
MDDNKLARTVRLTGQDVRAAERLLHLISSGDEGSKEPVPTLDEPAMTLLPPAQLLDRARATIARRRSRNGYFNPAMFGEPAWDMLLSLYVSDSCGERPTTVKLAGLVDAPLSSAIRWLSYLEKERLIERIAHPTDRRIAFLKLTQKARQALESYLTQSDGALHR